MEFWKLESIVIIQVIYKESLNFGGRSEDKERGIDLRGIQEIELIIFSDYQDIGGSGLWEEKLYLGEFSDYVFQ